MTDLRDKVARAVATALWRCGGGDEADEPDAYDLTNNTGRWKNGEVADAILALPEIAEALRAARETEQRLADEREDGYR